MKKFIAVFLLMFVMTSCSFLSRHPEILDDVKKVEKIAVEDAASDIKEEIDNQKVPNEKNILLNASVNDPDRVYA